MNDPREARVRALLDAARAIAAAPEPLVPALVASTGLSREGVLLGLRRHLESDASDEEVAALVRAAGEASEVTVILSANVFVAPLRALALACAAAPAVRVRASRREPEFPRALLAALGSRARALGVELRADIELAALRGGEVHVYGRQATLDAVRKQLAEGVIFRGHGPGLGVAVLAGGSLEADAHALTDDVIAFDQRGCLSPRIALVQGGAARGEAFADMLHRCLAAAEERVPRGIVDATEREALTRYASTLAFAGDLWRGAAHLVGAGSVGAPLLLPPAGRNVHVATWQTPEDLARLLAPIAPQVVAIGIRTPNDLSAALPAHARVSALGFMQKPRLDGPVDRRDLR